MQVWRVWWPLRLNENRYIDSLLPSEVSKWSTLQKIHIYIYLHLFFRSWGEDGWHLAADLVAFQMGGGREVVPIGHNGSHFLTLKGSIASWNFRIFNKKYIVKGFIWKPALLDYRRAIILSNCWWTKILHQFGWLTHVNTPKLSGMQHISWGRILSINILFGCLLVTWTVRP